MKPLSFRILDFKSIRDCGECAFSADGITVLAGQNESGKTAVLSALRDFDLPAGSDPQTPDYLPEDRFDADPRVSVFFEVDQEELLKALQEDTRSVPATFFEEIKRDGGLRVTRKLIGGTFFLEPKFDQLWFAEALSAAETGEGERNTETDANGKDKVEEENSSESADDEESIGTASAPFSNPAELATYLRDCWPAFVYFDSFQDMIPRTVELDDLVDAKTTPATGSAPQNLPKSRKVPQSVFDFITQSGMDLNKVSTFVGQEKTLSNYLTSCSTKITGDFLYYWKQRSGTESVQLQVKHQRDDDGSSQLAFYVHDKFDQYPEQRSKGFVWFLSFYLRLAAAYTLESREQRSRILLIDEPGTYLHARAQRDVLHLFEDRLVKKDQIVYSTHSPFLLPADRLHRIRIVLKTDQNGTVVLDRLTHPLLRTGNFSDTLSPILTAVGMEVTGSLQMAKDKNLLVEGISDHYYLAAWRRLLKIENWDFAVFPCTGAMSVVTFSSLFIGWGLKFLALLDRDDQGNNAKRKLEHDLGVYPKAIVQPRNAAGIEDLLSPDDFRELLKEHDADLKPEVGETPTACIRRLGIDKVLLGRKYAELAFGGKLPPSTKKTLEGIERLFEDIAAAWHEVSQRDSSLALPVK